MNENVALSNRSFSHKSTIPLATIHLLTYNRFDNIYHNLDSIFAQTYGNIEIIIADDGSENFPEKDIRDYIEKKKGNNISNVTILANRVNVGTVKNLNNAISNSNGVVYIPLSQDDLFFNDSVVELIMHRFNDMPYDVLITSRYGVNKSGDFQRFWPHIKARRVIEKMSQKEMFRAYSESLVKDIASGSVMNISADFLKQFGMFDERYRLWEDGPFFHKCLRLGYKIDTAYDIVSIKYEQTEGVSNLLNSSQYMRNDILLFWDTDFQEKKNDFGLFHRRYIAFFNFKRKRKGLLSIIFSIFLFPDVYVYKFFYSDFIRNWGSEDEKWNLKLSGIL